MRGRGSGSYNKLSLSPLIIKIGSGATSKEIKYFKGGSNNYTTATVGSDDLAPVS